MAQIDFKECSAVISDGTGTPLETEIIFGEGNFTWSRKTPRKYIPNRGKIAGADGGTVRNDDQVPLELSFAANLLFLVSRSPEDVTVYEALHQEGAASAWVSVSDDACEPYACDITFTFNPICGSTYSEVWVFPEFRVEDCSPDAKGGTVAFSGKCKAVKPTITRIASV